MTSHLLTSRLQLSRQVLFRLTCKNFSLWESYSTHRFQPCTYNPILAPRRVKEKRRRLSNPQTSQSRFSVFSNPRRVIFALANAERRDRDPDPGLRCGAATRDAVSRRAFARTEPAPLLLRVCVGFFIRNITERQRATYLCG